MTSANGPTLLPKRGHTSSAPALLDAARACDFYGLTPGNSIEQADAVQAYVQADMKGRTYVCLPPEAWPESWKGMTRPVVRLKKALYGHPDSGSFWEEHCDEQVRSVGFEPLPPEWQSCYYHPVWKACFVIYVDDFKLGGPTGKLAWIWQQLKSTGLNI